MPPALPGSLSSGSLTSPRGTVVTIVMVLKVATVLTIVTVVTVVTIGTVVTVVAVVAVVTSPSCRLVLIPYCQRHCHPPVAHFSTNNQN